MAMTKPLLNKSVSLIPSITIFTRVMFLDRFCMSLRRNEVDYAHRMQRIVTRIQQLSSVFCLDVCLCGDG